MSKEYSQADELWLVIWTNIINWKCLFDEWLITSNELLEEIANISRIAAHIIKNKGKIKTRIPNLLSRKLGELNKLDKNYWLNENNWWDIIWTKAINDLKKVETGELEIEQFIEDINSEIKNILEFEPPLF